MGIEEPHSSFVLIHKLVNTVKPQLSAKLFDKALDILAYIVYAQWKTS